MPNIEALSTQYRTYAVDNIYDCGRSIYTRPLKSPDDFVHWLDELFTALELGDHINLMGEDSKRISPDGKQARLIYSLLSAGNPILDLEVTQSTTVTLAGNYLTTPQELIVRE